MKFKICSIHFREEFSYKTFVINTISNLTEKIEKTAKMMIRVLRITYVCKLPPSGKLNFFY